MKVSVFKRGLYFYYSSDDFPLDKVENTGSIKMKFIVMKLEVSVEEPNKHYGVTENYSEPAIS